MQRAGRIDEHRVGIGITIEIRPGERARAEHAGERLLDLPRAVAVVPQHDGRAVADADDEIEVAVHLDVGRPTRRRSRRCGNAPMTPCASRR